jgi:ParB family chromosome partitioning protein
MAERKRSAVLGRGLAALLEEAGPGSDVPERITVALADVVANPSQPRRRFDAEALAELTESVRLHGILQPILVRPLGSGQYEIVAGERRWRAAQAIPLHEIPVVIRELDRAAAFEIALIENIQRADLNPIEEAEGFARLIRDYGHTQEALGKIVGKARSHVANLLRLLDLPDPVRRLLENGALSMGHARALIGSPDASALAERIVEQRLSVRQIEALVRAQAADAKSPRRAKLSRDPNVAELELQLADVLGMTVHIASGDGAGKGRMTVDFSTLDQLDLLCSLLNGQTR